MYISREKLKRDLIDNRSFYPAIVKNAIENAPTEDVVPRSEVERLQKQLDDKQFRCDSCDRIALTSAEHKHCIKQVKQEVAKQILKAFSPFRALSPNFCKVYNEFEKKYIGE